MVRVHFSPPASFYGSTHLENCTGKETDFCEVKSVTRKIPVRSEAEETKKHKSKYLQLLLNSLRKVTVGELARSSEKERRVDAMALIAEEGRDKLRKVEGSCK